MVNLKRYEPCTTGSAYIGMQEVNGGEWVKFDDIKEFLPIVNNSKQQLKAKILLLIQRTKQCACADDMGSVKGLLEQIDAKLSAV